MSKLTRNEKTNILMADDIIRIKQGIKTMKVKTHEHLQGWNKEDLIVLIKLKDQNITWMRKEIKMLKKEIKILKEESKNNMIDVTEL